MNVKLVSITQSKIEEKELSPEGLIIYTARVSNPSNQLSDDIAGLIRYMLRKKHVSPFEMVDLTVEIKTSRAIAAQLLRHRSFSFQEFSQRYAMVTEMEPVQIRKQATRNRQSSTEEFDPEIQVDCGNDFSSSPASETIYYHLQYCQNLYTSLIESGVAKEVARMVLPMTTETTIYMKGSIRSWLSYLNVRLEESTQKEHRDIAVAIADIIEEHFPIITESLNGFVSRTGNFM